MRRLQSVFLAGPDADYPDAEALAERRRALCRDVGLTPVLPRDGLDAPARSSEVQARALYATALANLRGADAVIANLTPWRGPGADPATAFLVGFASALGKPVFAYMNLEEEADAEYLGRVQATRGAELDGRGGWRDAVGAAVEDFDLPESPLLWAEARRLVLIVTPEPFEELAGLEMCLEGLREYAD